ncbi:MAG: type II toxin-antitoxin system VapC family toxin, partial [Pseudomonadota bacterium]
MITAIDTNILLDILGGDPKFGPLSAAALRRCISEGAVVACEVVWAETATFFEKEGQYLKAMEMLGIVFDPIDQSTALKAGSAWRHYRKNGGKRARVAADFLIGAHAASECNRLLTR